MATQQGRVDKNGAGIIGVFIGLAVLFFALLLVVFVLSTVLTIFMVLAPVAGLILAAYGSFRYWQSDVDHEQLNAMKIVALGLGIALLGVIF